jgi:hypothetical protein
VKYFRESINPKSKPPAHPHHSSSKSTTIFDMLDVFDFIVEKGGNPQKIKESQRRRYAPEEAVDEVIALYEDHRKSMSKPCNSPTDV